MPLIWDDDLVQVDLTTEGEWVKIKRKLSVGDRARLRAQSMAGMRATMNMKENGSGVYKPGDMEMLPMELSEVTERAEFSALEMCLKEWSFTFPHGEPVPVTPENIRRLDPDDVSLIKDRINDLNPVRSAEEKKDSSTTASPPSEAAALGPTS